MHFFFFIFPALFLALFLRGLRWASTSYLDLVRCLILINYLLPKLVLQSIQLVQLVRDGVEVLEVLGRYVGTVLLSLHVNLVVAPVERLELVQKVVDFLFELLL